MLEAPKTVATPFGYGALRPHDDDHNNSSPTSGDSDNSSGSPPTRFDIDADCRDRSGSGGSSPAQEFACVQFPWGRAYMHTELVATAPVFTFYALSKTERIKFAMPFPLTSPGSDMVDAVRHKLGLGDDIAITLVQTDSVNKHEIKPDKKISECTIGADPKHPILVLQAPLVRYDPKKCSYYMVLQENNTAVIQVAKGLGSVLGNCEVTCGVKYWEVELQSSKGGEGVFLGVASSDLPLNGSILNRGIFWGISCGTGHKVHDIIDYYTDPFHDGDVVGVLLDMEYGRLSFYRNGKYLGVAYRGVELKRLSPAFSLTYVGQRVKLLSTSAAPVGQAEASHALGAHYLLTTADAHIPSRIAAPLNRNNIANNAFPPHLITTLNAVAHFAKPQHVCMSNIGANFDQEELGSLIGGSLATFTHVDSAALDKMAGETATTSVAHFAAGCFWGVELAFQRIEGVVSTTVGYAQGHVDNASYKQVCSGKTGHSETIKIEFDPSKISYTELLAKFWSVHDPTTLNRQKEDVGTQYRSGIYYHDDEQKAQAIASKEAQQKVLDNEIVTEIEEFRVFWPAEDYHQRYLEKGGQCADKGSDVPIKCYG